MKHISYPEVNSFTLLLKVQGEKFLHYKNVREYNAGALSSFKPGCTNVKQGNKPLSVVVPASSLVVAWQRENIRLTCSLTLFPLSSPWVHDSLTRLHLTQQQTLWQWDENVL